MRKVYSSRLLRHLYSQHISPIVLNLGHLLFPVPLHFNPVRSPAVAKLLQMIVDHLGIPFVTLQQAVDDVSRNGHDSDGEEGKDLDPHKGKHPGTQLPVVGLLLLVPPGNDPHDDEHDDRGEDCVEKVANATYFRKDRGMAWVLGTYTGNSP